MSKTSAFLNVRQLASTHKVQWAAIKAAEKATLTAEVKLKDALNKNSDARPMGSDLGLILCGSFARYEMTPRSDFDWCLLVDGCVDGEHARLAGQISQALTDAGLQEPGSSGVFGNLVFSHDLVHNIGGGSDSNANLTRRMLLLLEARPLEVSPSNATEIVWKNVLSNILKRYFEEDVHFSPKHKRRVPRLLLNDLSRYWRTICVDYAAKHRDQDGAKWAIRNAKLRMSRKLLFAAGLAFCFSCELDPPKAGKGLVASGKANDPAPFIENALRFASAPPLDYLCEFILKFVNDPKKQREVARLIIGPYNQWIEILSDDTKRLSLEKLSHEDASEDKNFEHIRKISKNFASGLHLLFFNQKKNIDPIANLSLNYVGF